MQVYKITIDDYGPQTQVALAKHHRIAKSKTVAIVDGLEVKELVERMRK